MRHEKKPNSILSKENANTFADALILMWKRVTKKVVEHEKEWNLKHKRREDEK